MTLNPHKYVWPDQTDCDRCGDPYPVQDRHVVALPRPSDPDELCAVMWYCPECGDATGTPTAREVFDLIESGEPFEGRRYLWVDV